MAELKHTLTLDDSEFKKKMQDANKLALQSSNKIASETNKAINEENTNRKKVVTSINEQVQAQKALKLEIAQTNEKRIQSGPVVTPANVQRVREIAEAQKYYNSTVTGTVVAQKQQTTATRQTEAATKATQRSIQSLQLQLQSYQAIASKAVNPAIMQEYNAKIQQTQVEITRMSNAGKQGFDAMGNAIKSNQGVLQKMLAGISRLAYILPGFGIAGILALALDPLMEFIQSLDLFAKKMTDAERETDALGKALKSSDYTSAVQAMDSLQKKVELAKDGMYDKNAVVKDYNDTIGKATGLVTDLDGVEAGLARNAEGYIRMTLAKAAAQEALTQATEATAEQAKIQARESEEFIGVLDKILYKFSSYGAVGTTGQNRRIANAALQDIGEENKQKELDKAEKKRLQFLDLYNKKMEEAAKVASDLGIELGYQAETDEKAARARNKSLDERISLMRKIADLEAEYNRKSLSSDEAEIQAVRDKFAALAQEIKKFNDDPDNKVKIDVTALDSIRDKAIADLRYKQDTAALKAELEIQRDLYRDFEEFRTQFGEEKARERYGNLLDLETSHLSRLQSEIEQLQSKEGRTAGEDARLTMLQENAEKEVQLQRDKLDKLLGGILSFNERRAALEEKHAREIAQLGTEATDQQLSELRKKHNAELSDLRDDFRKEYTEELAGINSKEDLARGLAEISKFRIDKETELQRKLLDIGIKAARERIAVLEREEKELGIDNRDEIEAENQFIARSENHLDHLTKNYIHIGKELGALLASSSDDFVAKVGNMISEVSNSLGQFQSGGSDLEKAQGFVGLFIAIGKTLKQTFIDIENKELETLKAMTQEVANRISFEAKLNKLYAERAKEINDNVFLGADFTEAAQNAAKESEAALKVFDDAMQAIFEGGIFSAEGKGKRNLFGTKKGNYDFSFQDILSQLMGVNVDLDDSSKLVQWLGNVLDPLSIFGKDAARRAEKDAFGKIQTAVSSALDAMGKSVEDFANFSGQEMLDFFTLMEEGGYITDSATKQLIQDGREAAEVMKEAEAAIEGVIKSLAGDLGSNLRTALVDAFKAGEDAAEAFEKSVGQVLENIISQMIFDEIFREDFEELQKQMEGSLKGGDGDLTDDIVDFYKKAADNVPAFTDALETARKEAEAAGLDILGGDKEPEPASPLVGAIKGITADQADLLAGQFAGMRLVNLEMLELDKVRNSMMGQYSELMTDQLASLNLIVFNTGATATNTARLESIEVTLKSMNNKMNSSQNALEASGIGG